MPIVCARLLGGGHYRGKPQPRLHSLWRWQDHARQWLYVWRRLHRCVMSSGRARGTVPCTTPTEGAALAPITFDERTWCISCLECGAIRMKICAESCVPLSRVPLSCSGHLRGRKNRCPVHQLHTRHVGGRRQRLQPKRPLQSVSHQQDHGRALRSYKY